jgi:hypothetical protein
MRQILIDKYLDYVNNYLTLDKFAEHNEISSEHAFFIISFGRDYHEEYVKMMQAQLGDNDYKSQNVYETGR